MQLNGVNRNVDSRWPSGYNALTGNTRGDGFAPRFGGTPVDPNSEIYFSN